ncbi:MAG TPA: glycosyltransferase family 9 protein, partial [Myxococcota bacterium]|nr:glycosyltransferase family 9 protein [Myxococcota bacterium]
MSSDALYARTQESLRRSGEVVLVSSDRSAMLPTGGVFSPLRREPGRIDLGPPLLQRLADLEPEPVVALSLAERVLQDLELLHRLGGAHGAIDLDGWGFDDAGYFRVRPVFRADQELSQEADIRAVAGAIAALVTPEALEFAGFTQAKVWFQSLGSSRLGDARSVRQGLVALIGRRPIQEPLQEFLVRVGGQLPPLARSFDVVPVVAPRQDVRLNQRDRAQTDARLWVEAERQRLLRLPGCFSLHNDLNSDELAAILGGAALFVGCDSGPAHVAQAVGTRTVLLFGGTEPHRWG